MGNRGPGRSERAGISVVQLAEMIPDETTATEWFEKVVWPDGRKCPH